MPDDNATRSSRGEAIFKKYCDLLHLPKAEREQDYSITDCIVDLMHFARSKGFDGLEVWQSAEIHFNEEVEEEEDEEEDDKDSDDFADTFDRDGYCWRQD